MDNGSLQVPERWDWRRSYEIEKEYFWDPAPLHRKLLLFGGLALLIFNRLALRAARRVHALATRQDVAPAPGTAVGD
jgi:hypothetical protein